MMMMITIKTQNLLNLAEYKITPLIIILMNRIKFILIVKILRSQENKRLSGSIKIFQIFKFCVKRVIRTTQNCV